MTQVAVTNSFQPSQYQLNLFDWVVNGTGHAVVKAVPGSGKSTSLIKASKLLTTSNAVFLAFNKAIEIELNEKLQAEGSLMKAQTINSFGFSALRATGKKYKVDGNKYHPICRQYLESQYIEGYTAYEYKRLQKLKKMVSLARMTMVNTSSETAILDMCSHYDIDLDPLYEKEEWAVMWRGIASILKIGEQQAKELGIIDFDDQVYLPIIWGLTPEKKDWIFIDECQDLNAARLELIIRSVNGTGRLLFVGDPFQSIYGFSGADTDSINNIIQRTRATVLPLSICYRCPSSHIDLCASIFPGLEARPNAPKGTIETIHTDKLYELVHPGDLVLCRMNAPLVSTCLNLIRNGVRAKVRGSDIGANFVATIKKLQKQYPRLNMHTFVEIINSYRDQQAILIGVGDDADMKVAALDDKVDTMKALREAYCTENTDAAYWTMDGFYSYIENFFSDERGPLVILSTVHKAKGLEENRVFILQPEKMPHPKAKPGWQYEQELNIKYVAFSRSKDALYFVSDKIVPSSFDTEEDDVNKLVAIAEEIATQSVIVEASVTVSEAQETAQAEETINVPVATTKRPYGGRKAIADEDKRVVYQQMWDGSIKTAFRAFVEAQPEKMSESEVLEAVLLGKLDFTAFFHGSQQEAEYNDRQVRAEQKREDYKNRNRKKKGNDNEPDPDGGGQPIASNPEISPVYGCKDCGKPVERAIEGELMCEECWNKRIEPESYAINQQIIEMQSAEETPLTIRRVAYNCLRPSCHRSWLTDYYEEPIGLAFGYAGGTVLYRIDENGQRIYAANDFPRCPYCSNKHEYIKVRYPKMQHSSTRKCDSRCWNAKPGSDCSCACGGLHHATGNGNNNIIGQALLVE